MTTSNSERVELLVQNTPGVLGRITAHIRLEGWNIKRLFVDTFSEDGRVGEDAFVILSPMDFAASPTSLQGLPTR